MHAGPLRSDTRSTRRDPTTDPLPPLPPVDAAIYEAPRVPPPARPRHLLGDVVRCFGALVGSVVLAGGGFLVWVCHEIIDGASKATEPVSVDSGGLGVVMVVPYAAIATILLVAGAVIIGVVLASVLTRE